MVFKRRILQKKYFSESPSTNGFIRGHRDSSLLKNHELFSKVKNDLRLPIFFDESESTNPLGSKTKKQELSMFNFKILNLPECENSRLSNIHSFAVCNSKDLKDAEFSFFIDEFMKEIRLLESCNTQDYRYNETLYSGQGVQQERDTDRRVKII
jgi:hypothetical protein